MSTLFALHGFLGLPTDWEILKGKMLDSVQVIPIDLFNSSNIYVDHNLKGAARELNLFAKKNSSSPRILMGYSLGGRLSLHALIDSPNVWQGAIIISAHPGLVTKEEKEERLKLDSNWEKLFASAEWNALLSTWNQQAIFTTQTSTPRFEKDFSRETLCKVLKKWSLSQQDNLRDQIGKLTIPILWIVGANDRKYVNIAKDIQLQNPLSNIWIAPHASHRVPWDMTDDFLLRINSFFQTINSDI